MATMTVAEINFKLERVREMSPVFHRLFCGCYVPSRIHMGYGLKVNRRQEAYLLHMKRKKTTMKRR